MANGDTEMGSALPCFRQKGQGTDRWPALMMTRELHGIFGVLFDRFELYPFFTFHVWDWIGARWDDIYFFFYCFF